MMQCFQEAYAEMYDHIYAYKDYLAECDLIKQAFRKYGAGGIKHVADWGCGTGSHTIPLAEQGYRMTGVDLSEDMLRLARRKAVAAGRDIHWVKGDIRDVQLPGQFDAGLFMFAVLGLLQTNQEVMAALHNARRHIRPKGLILFDVWYGPAVLTIKPSDSVKIIPKPNGRVIRLGTGKLDSRHHLCEVRFHLWHLQGDRLAQETEEVQIVRYFFPMELELMLHQSGFSLLSLTAFPTLDRPADETTWNAFGIACAVDSGA
jgi:SAM-dependent methyltransferase